MKTVLYYFSGTGNSLVVAQDLAKELGDTSVIPIARAMNDGGAAPADKVGLVFPVYMWGLPLIVASFIGKMKIDPQAYYFAVTTYGGFPGATLGQADRLFRERGATLSAGFGIKMPGNYTPMYGAKLILSADYRPDRMCDLFRDEKVTHSAGVPTVWLGMIEHIERTGETLGDLKIVTIGGSAAPRAMIKWFRDRGIQVGHAWGMTEMSPIGTIGAPPSNWDSLSDEQQMDYIAKQGRSLFNVELRTVDDDRILLMGFDGLDLHRDTPSMLRCEQYMAGGWRR
jgi:flavodoxin